MQYLCFDHELCMLNVEINMFIRTCWWWQWDRC